MLFNVPLTVPAAVPVAVPVIPATTGAFQL
jgi:hypothetical protein